MLLSSFASYAETKEERKGYTGNTECILGFLEIGLNTTQGYRFNNKWSIGANTGVNISWCGPVMPLCAVGQFDIVTGKSSSIVFNAKAGGIFALTNAFDVKNRAGGNFAFGVGFRYKRVMYQLAYNLVLMNYYQHDTQELIDGYGTLQLRIAYTFGAR
ncbi:MAG: hypothetical protein K2K97_07520 [Muribaculaceae bacterium]|nr:hypothetical protein [Muribaculaceae bacterium]